MGIFFLQSTNHELDEPEHGDTEGSLFERGIEYIHKFQVQIGVTFINLKRISLKLL